MEGTGVWGMYKAHLGVAAAGTASYICHLGSSWLLVIRNVVDRHEGLLVNSDQ